LPSTGSRFIADAMLGTLARKLRAFGLDTVYFGAGSDEDLLKLAKGAGRVILTSDRLLAARAASKEIPTLLIRGRTDGARISSLLEGARSSGIAVERGPPLCSVCGGALSKVNRADVTPFLPLRVVQRHRIFFHCESCGRYYWKGGHWKKLSGLERAFRHRNPPR